MKVTVNELAEDNEEDLKICPHDKSKICVQIDNIEELREIISNTAREVKGVGDHMEKRVDNIESNFNSMETTLTVMVESVNRTTRTVEELSKEVSNVLHMAYENKVKINTVESNSKLENMKQDNGHIQQELNSFVDIKNDRRKISTKAKITFFSGIATWVVLKVTGGMDIFMKFLYETPK